MNNIDFKRLAQVALHGAILAVISDLVLRNSGDNFFSEFFQDFFSGDNTSRSV